MELHRVYRRISAVAAAGVIGGLLFGGASPAGAVADVKIDRVAGTDRFGTAAEIATTAFPDGSDVVVLASGRAFPDALAGAALGLPLLLTEPGSLPTVTEDAIEDLGADSVLVLGGTAAVSDAVEDDLTGAGHDVTRLAGVNRYETAAEIALEVGDVAELDGKSTAIIATGLQFADALTGGPVAAAGDGATHPILLTNSGVPSATEDALETLGVEQVVILGGTAAVPATVETRLEQITGSPAIRLAGANRFATAVAVAEAALEDWDFDGTEVLLARGDNGPGNQGFADALAGGPFGGVLGAPIILTNPTSLPSESEQFFEDNSDTIDHITALGGTAAVSQSVLEKAEDAAETPGTARVNETFSVTPKEATTQANGTSRTYTASVGTTVVDIVIAPCANVIAGSDGKTRFANSNTNTIADNTASGGSAPDVASTPAYISSVNGTARQEQDPTIKNDYADDVTPANGAVTFIVSGPSERSTATTCVVPVVFEDADNADSLTVPTTNPAEPTEAFGTGGTVTFAPGAASGGQFNVNVNDNDDAANRFVGCNIVANQPSSPQEASNSDACATYSYDANDTFLLNGSPTTLDVFEVTLGAGDDVSGTFRPATADRSTFNLYQDEAPTPPTNAPGSPTETSSSVTVSFFESSQSTVDSYRLYRADMPASGTCPAAPAKLGPTTFSGTPYVLRGSADDPNPTSTPSQSPQVSITDTQVSPGTKYCYRLVSVDDGDEGPATEAITAETTTTTDAAAPKLVGATGASDDAVLDDGDVHRLTFDEAMGDPTEFGSYTVTGSNGGSQSIQCQVHASCSLSDDAMTLIVTMRPLVSTTLQYPLTITAISGMEDAATNDVNFAGSTDKTIENTTSAPTSTTPIIKVARAFDADPAGLGPGDVHELVFSEPMSESTARNGTYTVQGELFGPLSARTIDCASNTVECGLSADGDTLRVHILSGFASDAQYPLTITAVTNMTDREATPKSVDLTNSDDDVIDDETPVTDVSRPTITAALISADPGPDGWGESAGDKLVLTFSENVAPHVDNAAKVSQTELRAILGHTGLDAPTYNDDTLITLATSGAKELTLTVVKPLESGFVTIGEGVPGSSNPYVTDTAGNPAVGGGTAAVTKPTP